MAPVRLSSERFLNPRILEYQSQAKSEKGTHSIQMVVHKYTPIDGLVQDNTRFQNALECFQKMFKALMFYLNT